MTQTDGIGKVADDPGCAGSADEVPTLGNWFRAAGYDTHYDGKWHLPRGSTRRNLAASWQITTTREKVDASAVERYLDADPLAPYGFSGWVGPEPHGAPLANSGFRRDPLIAERVVNVADRPIRAAARGDPAACARSCWWPASRQSA